MKNLFTQKIRLAFILLILAFTNKMYAALQPGDIAIIGYKAEPSGEAINTSFEFTFILLANIPANEPTISFTDKGWINNAFSTNVFADGIIKWNPTQAYPAGTIIKVTITGAVNSGGPQVPASFTASNASFAAQTAVHSGWNNPNPNPGTVNVTTSQGDQVLVYQGTEASPTFIYGFTNTASESVHATPGSWASPGVANSASNSELPAGLVNGQTAIAHTNDANTPITNTRNATNGWSTDNLVFIGPFVGNKAAMLTNIGTLTNWNGSETVPADIVITPGGGTIPTTLAVPTIEITDASNNPILNGGPASAGNNTSFGTACVKGGQVSKTYTIKNTGFSDLTLTDTPKVIVGDAGASSYTVTLQPNSPIVSGGSTTVSVMFDPTSATNLLATLTIANNDATKNPFIINISGDGANPDATITSANTVCQESPLILSAPNVAGSTYDWNGSGVAATNTFINNAVPTAYGSITYTVLVTDAIGCTATGSKTVTVNPKPIVTLPAIPSLCYGEQATLTANCIMNVSAVLSPGANTSTATGYVYGTYNTLTDALNLTIVFKGLTSNITNSHIHIGAAGVNGGVIVPFGGWPTATEGSFTYTGSASVNGSAATNIPAFLAGNTYVNIHSVNFPGGEIRGQLIPVCSVDTYTWNVTEPNSPTITIWPAATQNYSVIGSNSITGCASDQANSLATVAPITLPTTAFTSITKDAAELYYFTPTCENIAEVIPSGVAPVAGNVTAKEWLETTPPFLYVPRHYEITPATNPNGVTGNITLYFSQNDFDAYNNTVTSNKLPTGPTDNAGIANFLIAKYAGTSPNGLPGAGGYSGPPTMIPESADSWNGMSGLYTMVFTNNIWKVTFPVSSFSGFIATSASNPLPVNLISFTGKATEKGNLLNWKTANEQNFSHFEIQRSVDAKAFMKLGEVKGDKNENYEFVDLTPSAINYYRLKMLDLDGKYSFSKVIFIENNSEKTIVGQFFPNPSQGKSFVEINTLEKGDWNISSFDLTGKLINIETKILQKGLNKISVEKLNQGVNFIRFDNGKILEIRKIIKE